MTIYGVTQMYTGGYATGNHTDTLLFLDKTKRDDKAFQIYNDAFEATDSNIHNKDAFGNDKMSRDEFIETLHDQEQIFVQDIADAQHNIYEWVCIEIFEQEISI